MLTNELVGDAYMEWHQVQLLTRNEKKKEKKSLRFSAIIMGAS